MAFPGSAVPLVGHLSRGITWSFWVGGLLGSTQCSRAQAPHYTRRGQALTGHGFLFLALPCSGCGLRANCFVQLAHTQLPPRATRSSLQGLVFWDVLSRSPSSLGSYPEDTGPLALRNFQEPTLLWACTPPPPSALTPSTNGISHAAPYRRSVTAGPLRFSPKPRAPLTADALPSSASCSFICLLRSTFFSHPLFQLSAESRGPHAGADTR